MGRRFQSALGTEFQRRYKEGQQIDTISLMSVTKVNYKYNTVDLIAVKHKETFTASYENEGKYSAKLPMEFGGRNIAGQPYGQINPITVGTLVLVGFIESDKNNPIILGVYARNDVNEKLARAPFASADPTDESLAKQMYQKYTLYPSLTYDSVDGDGTRVTSFSGKSFMIFDTTPNTNATMISDGNYGTSYEDLSTSFYNDGEVIEPMSGLAPNILFKHQGVLDSNEDPDDHQFMIHIASDGTYRTSQMKQGEDWRTMFEMDTEGQVRLRRQGDTIRLDDGVEIGEILIDKYGIVSLRNGETDLEVRKDGLYSKGKPLGEAIGGDIDLSDIYDKLGEIDTSIAFANTQITNINGEVKVVSEKTTVIDGQVKEMEASVSIMADKIETKVSSTQVEEMIDDSLSEFNKDIQKIKAEAEKANAVIADMANDNRLTPQEKTQLLAEWEIINSEYPSYINQANIYEVKSDAYTEAYEKLGDFVKPLLDKMEDTSVVDGVTMRKLFQTYYNERTALLSSVLKGLKDGITEAMKKAGDAQLDATTALADSAQAQIDANKANSLITDIASDGKLTPSEKSQLKKEWDIIVKDYPKTIEQATKYKVNTDEFTLKYNALKNVVDPLLADLTTTSIVNGQVLRDRMAEYYASKTQVLKDISDLAQDVMNDYGNRISTAETSIKQTSESISLLATKVETIGKDVEANKAELKIQADQISQKVTASQVKDVVKEAIDDIQVGGTNLYVIFTQTKGWLSDTDGTVGAVVDNSVVSNYIKVRETSPYVASLFNNTGTNTIVVCWYDTDRKFISGESIANTGDFSQAYKSPAKAVYARVSYKKAPNTLMKFESGTKATDFSYAWDDIKNDQTLLQTYIKEVEEQAKKAQTDADDAKNNADLANKQIDDMANDNIVTPTEKQQLLLQWEEVKTEYPLNLDQASKFGVTSTNYTNSYKALETYLTPILADMTKSSAIIGSTLRSTFKSYFDRKTTLLNSVAEIAKTLATNAQGKADQLDDDMNNIGGYNYVGFSSGDDILPRLMIKNLGYYSVYNSVQDFADNMVSIKQKTAGTWFGYDVGTTDNNKFSSLADFRMKEVKEGQWITVSSNLQVFGTGSVNMKIYLYNDGWKESSSKNVKATDGVTRVVSQQKVASNTTGILVRFRANDSTVNEFRFGNVQVEVGIRATPWKKSDIDISEDINNTAQKVQDDLERQLNTAKEEAKADYNNALSQAQKAQTNADKANQAIADLSNDNLVTPSEKLDLKKEWEVIVAEKPVNDTQATKFGVSNTAYTTAYTALNNYLTPILADLTTNSTIVGQTMRNTFKAYYTARTNLLNSISVKAKELADKAQSDATNASGKATQAQTDANKAQELANKAQSDATSAQSNASKAQTDANKANQSITDLSNDNLVTPVEKSALKKEWDTIVAEKPINDTQATKFGVSNTAYTTAYTALSNYITPILSSMSTNSTIVGQTMRDTFKAYYTARTNLLNAVSVKAKELADNAQTDADTAQTNADKALEDANKAQNDIDNLTIGGTNIIQVAQIEANKSGATSATVKSYDEKTRTYTIVVPATSTSVYGAGLTITSSPKKTLIPWGATYIVSFEIKVPKASSWNVGVNNYLNLVADSSKTVDVPVTGITTSAEQIDITYKASDPTPDAVTADNDDVPKRKASSKTLDPNVWVKCWFSYVNTNAKNTDKLDLYDASFFGIVMTGETKDMEYQIRNVKGELGTRPTEWSPAPEDVEYLLNQAVAESKADYEEALKQAQKAQTDANKANQSISDLSNDNLATPNEKLELKKEWEIIVAEKPINDTQADKFSISKTTYGTAYTALNNYITPILSSLTTNSTIVGQTMRDTFKAYYTARTNLLNAISVKAKDLADKAQTDANKAQNSADNAQSSADSAVTKANQAQSDANKAQSDANKAQSDATKANQSITDLSNDNLVTPSEKLDLKKDWQIIVAEKAKIDAQADKFSVSKMTYGTTYTALNNYLTPIFADMSTNSTIVGQTMRDTFKTYYTARTDILNAIATKAKELADKAQTDANKIKDDLDNLTIGGTNIIQVAQIKQNGSTIKSYDEKTRVYTILAPSTSTSGYGAGLLISDTPKNTLIPWGATYIVSFEIKVPRACSWNVDVNNYPVTGASWNTNDNDATTLRKTSTTTLDPEVWVKCWFSYVNSSDKNVDKVDLRDNSNFGVVMKTETEDMEYQIRNVKGELGTRPTAWSPAPEDVQEQLNGKEGTWIYQPTAPSSPSVGLVWVNTTEVPYQPRRYTGAEAGWVALTPEEVSDLPWGEDGSNLADWVSQAEQKIQADSIINTVLGSNDFTTIFDGKANAEDLNNLANYDDLEAMRDEYERLLQQGLDGIDFTPYVTQSELTQLKDSFNFSIQQAGGVNMVKNSLGYQGTEFWDDGQNTNLLRNSNFDVGDGLTYWNKGSGSTIADAVVQPDGGMHVARWQGSASIKWLGIQQAVYQSVNTGDEITVSFYAKAYSGKTAKPYIGIHWRDQSSAIVDQSWQTATSISATLTRFSLTFTCPRDNISAVNIMFYAESNTDFDIGYTRVKAELGSVATEWTPNPNDFSANQWIQTIANEDLATLGFGSGFLFNNHASAYLRQPVQLPEVKTGLQYGFSFYMSVYDDASPVKVNAGARIIENNTGVVTTVGLTDLSTGIPAGYNRYAIVFEPSSADITIELFVEQGDKATVVISGIMLNIGNLALKWQPFPSEIYNTNVRIDINGITVKNNQTDGYTMITPQEFSGYAKVDNVMERIFTLNGQVTEVKMLRAEERITMEPITIFAMNTTNNRGWAFVGALPESDN